MRRKVATFAFLGIAAFSSSLLAGDAAVIDGDAGFPEGPYWTDGKLYYAEYGSHQVSVWDGTSTTVLWTQEGCGPSAVMPFQDGWLVTCYDNGSYVKIAPDGATLQVWDKDSTGAAILGPNDLTTDGKGGAYVTASGPWESGPIVGKVYHLTADGALVPVADDLHYANGIQLSADGTRLYVNESEAGRVISFAVGEDGSLGDRRLFVRLAELEEPAGAYPDGIKLGPDGNLYVGLYSAGRIVVVSPEGALVRKLEVPSPAAPNLAFGPDGKTVYVMAVDDQANAPYKGKVYAIANE
jgi:sugar lactone lactonase YvrE